MEQEDREILYHLEDFLKRGSMIFFAIEDNQVLATGMVIPTSNNVWEICKLAADENHQGN